MGRNKDLEDITQKTAEAYSNLLFKLKAGYGLYLVSLSGERDEDFEAHYICLTPPDETNNISYIARTLAENFNKSVVLEKVLSPDTIKKLQSRFSKHIIERRAKILTVNMFGHWIPAATAIDLATNGYSFNLWEHNEKDSVIEHY